MPISRCTRCDQLIDFDASHEGDEVLCPACDNITRLVALPEDELPAETSDSESGESTDARAPIRLAAEELPPPAADPVAPAGAPDHPADARGPELLKSDPVADPDELPPAAAKPEKSAGELDEIEQAAIRILSADSDSERDDFQFATADEDSIRLRLPLDRPWLLFGLGAGALAVLVFAFSFIHEKVEESKPLTEEDVRAILATQTRVGVVDPEPITPPRPPVMVTEPEPEPVPVPSMVGAPAPAGGKAAVDVRFPTLPTELARDPDRAESEAFRFYTEMAFNEPFRLFGDTVIDLRTLRFAANAGMTDFPDGWRLLGGLVHARDAEGLQLRLDRRFHAGGGIVLVSDFPEVFRVQRDQPVGLLLRAKGSRRAKVAEGEEQVLENYEFGLLPSAPMVKIAEIKAAEREAIARREREALAKRQADEAAMEEAKKKRELDARTVNFLRSRVEKGFASAQYRLGLRYLEGEGVPKNREEGLRLLRAAAAQDYREAKAKLGELEQQ